MGATCIVYVVATGRMPWRLLSCRRVKNVGKKDAQVLASRQHAELPRHPVSHSFKTMLESSKKYTSCNIYIYI